MIKPFNPGSGKCRRSKRSAGLDLPLIDEYQTIGGFVIYHLQKIPNQGEKMTYGAIEITITAADGPRIDCLRLHKLDAAEDATDLAME
jgi:CBS domain containing-hemolysin-like protein